MTAGRVLHTGALVAFANGSIYMASVLRWAIQKDIPLSMPTGAFAQAWARTGPDDRYRLDYLAGLSVVAPVAMSLDGGRKVGDLLAQSSTEDTVAGHCVQLADAGGWSILTEDASQLRIVRPDVDVDEVP